MINNQLDQIDLKIIDLLQQDSRLTHKQIGNQLHRSGTAIQVRIKRLIADGYIKNYTVTVDHKKMGKGLVAYTLVEIRQHTHESLRDFQSEVVKLDGVTECSHLTGSFDFLLKIVIGDIGEYQDLLMNRLSKIPQVGKMQSLFMMSETLKRCT
ncbi:Lrp/AsnC family transcriptional regulator [Mucilaginibacter sp. McL0603]|uniref:Lrp/AsnC family transcriptional regulator n=1 Tax=Mucilaginibacter sp. McL0603 TaxID=3415670 RepID=UPI003CEB91B4